MGIGEFGFCELLSFLYLEDENKLKFNVSKVILPIIHKTLGRQNPFVKATNHQIEVYGVLRAASLIFLWVNPLSNAQREKPWKKPVWFWMTKI